MYSRSDENTRTWPRRRHNIWSSSCEPEQRLLPPDNRACQHNIWRREGNSEQTKYDRCREQGDNVESGTRRG